MQHFEQRIEESRAQDRPQTRQKLEELDSSASNQSRYILDVSRFPVHENTTAEYFLVQGRRYVSGACEGTETGEEIHFY